MRGIDGQKIQQLFRTVSKFGKSALITQAQAMLMPHILDIFADNSHERLREMIIVDYDLVQQETPPGVKQALDNLGSNSEMRRQWEGVVMQVVTPTNIKAWLRHPEEWLDADEADRQREELRKCAEVIESSERGEEWLKRQVIDIYRMANIVPKTAKTAETDD